MNSSECYNLTYLNYNENKYKYIKDTVLLM